MQYDRNIRTIFLILFLSSMPVLGFGQTVFKLNQYNILHNKNFMPVFTLYAAQSFSDTWGISTYFYVNGVKGNSWGEGLAGPTYTPVKGLSLSFLAGFQSNEDQLFRVSPMINYSSKKLAGFAALEFGGERYRWDIMAFYLVNQFKAGGELIRFYQMYAAGPRLEFTFVKKQPITIFYSQLWDWTNDKPASMFGVYSSFASNK